MIVTFARWTGRHCGPPTAGNAAELSIVGEPWLWTLAVGARGPWAVELIISVDDKGSWDLTGNAANAALRKVQDTSSQALSGRTAGEVAGLLLVGVQTGYL